MLAALSVVAVLVGGVMFASAPTTDEAVAAAQQEKARSSTWHRRPTSSSPGCNPRHLHNEPGSARTGLFLASTIKAIDFFIFSNSYF